MKVLNFGSLNVDYVYSVDHIVLPGETIGSAGRNIFSGGKGLNQSVAMAKAGLPVYHAGIVGNDGQILLDTLKKYGIHDAFMKQVDAPGGHTVIQVDKNGQNSIVVYGGTNYMLDEGYITGVLQSFGKGDTLVLQNETNNTGFIMEAAHKRGLAIVFNPSPCDDSIAGLPLHLVTYLVINETEGKAIAGVDGQQDIIAALSKKYPDMRILLTLGERGSQYYEAGELFEQKAFSVSAVDTTGAGDTYLGYFLYGILNRMPPNNAMELAAKASAIAVTKKGAADSIPFLDDVEKSVIQ